MKHYYKLNDGTSVESCGFQASERDDAYEISREEYVSFIDGISKVSDTYSDELENRIDACTTLAQLKKLLKSVLVK